MLPYLGVEILRSFTGYATRRGTGGVAAIRSAGLMPLFNTRMVLFGPSQDARTETLPSLSQNSKCCSFVIPFTAVKYRLIQVSHSIHCH